MQCVFGMCMRARLKGDATEIRASGKESPHRAEPKGKMTAFYCKFAEGCET